jgi:hypothetical protein
MNKIQSYTPGTPVNQVIEDMQKCYQIPGKQTVWQHGESVRDQLMSLYDYCKDDNQLDAKLPKPEWLTKNRELIGRMLYPRDVLERYALFHDLGKPYCQVQDPDG